MICEECHGRGWVRERIPFLGRHDLYDWWAFAVCPSCFNGTIYCCAGEVAHPEPPRPDEPEEER